MSAPSRGPAGQGSLTDAEAIQAVREKQVVLETDPYAGRRSINPLRRRVRALMREHGVKNSGRQRRKLRKALKRAVRAATRGRS